MIETAVLCLALNVYHEARSEVVPAQYAVALVTWNRAQRDPKRICSTVTAPKQFSWANTNLERVRGGFRIRNSGMPKDGFAWWKAVRIAEVTLAGRMHDFTNGATHYHTTAVRPIWRHRMQVTWRHGAHIFYKSS